MTLCVFVHAPLPAAGIVFVLGESGYPRQNYANNEEKAKKPECRLVQLFATHFLPIYHPCRMTHLTEQLFSNQVPKCLLILEGKGKVGSCVSVWRGVQGVHEGAHMCWRYDSMSKRHLVPPFLLFFSLIHSHLPPKSTFSFTPPMTK